MPVSAVCEKIEMCGATPKGEDVLAGDRFQTSGICGHAEPTALPLTVFKICRLHCAITPHHEKVEMADPSRPPHSGDRLPGRCLPGA